MLFIYMYGQEEMETLEIPLLSITIATYYLRKTPSYLKIKQMEGQDLVIAEDHMK